MKYQINESPQYSVVPVIELKPDETGVITHAGIYDYGSVIHYLKDSKRWYSLSLVDDIWVRSRRLADFDDADLHGLETAHDFPLDELVELRNLEKEYRKSQEATLPDRS